MGEPSRSDEFDVEHLDPSFAHRPHATVTAEYVRRDALEQVGWLRDGEFCPDAENDVHDHDEDWEPVYRVRLFGSREAPDAL